LDFTEHFVEITRTVAALPVSYRLIDGEAVILRPDGHSDFHALRGRAGGAKAALIAFDLLSIGSSDLRKHPLETRCDYLAELVKGHEAILFSQTIQETVQRSSSRPAG
jgi:bifunctional non-homologous end joining protein LigD